MRRRQRGATPGRTVRPERTHVSCRRGGHSNPEPPVGVAGQARCWTGAHRWPLRATRRARANLGDREARKGRPAARSRL